MVATLLALLSALALRGASGLQLPPARHVSPLARSASPADWPSALSEACEVDYEEDDDSFGVGSAAALVAGTTVGAGVLALPAATRGAGFVASSGVLVGSWVFMAVAALLVAETSVDVVCTTKRVDLGFLATVRSLCGRDVGSVAGAAYAFIHYALLVAYCAQGGALAAAAVGAAPAAGAVGFSAVFGSAVAFGPAAVVDALNNAFVVVVVASFGALLALGSSDFDAAALVATAGDGTAAFAAIPISILALVYHNVVPLVATRLRGDRGKITAAILIGSAVPLVMFLAWNALILGAVDADAVAAAGGDPVAALLATTQGNAGAQALGVSVGLFSFSAVVTSFVGFFYGLRSYLRDLLLGDDDAVDGPRRAVADNDVLLAGLVLVPPTLVAAVDPKVFLPALDAAGTFGITTLFGIVPAVSAFRMQTRDDAYVPGGSATLAAMVALSAAVIVEGALDLLGVSVAGA